MVFFINTNPNNKSIELGTVDLIAESGDRIRVSYNDDDSITFVSYTTKDKVTYTCCVEDNTNTIMNKINKNIQIKHVTIAGNLEEKKFTGKIGIQYMYSALGMFGTTYTPGSKESKFSVNLYTWFKGGNKKTKRGNKKRHNKTAKRRRRV